MGPTTDLFSTELDNLLSVRRQQEILEVVDRLKEFKPTKVAIEFEKKKNDATNEKSAKIIDAAYGMMYDADVTETS